MYYLIPIRFPSGAFIFPRLESAMYKSVPLTCTSPYNLLEFSLLILFSFIASKRFFYFDEIKRMKVEHIQSFYVEKQEGKIDHHKGWENTLEKWMERHRVIQNLW